MKEPKRKGRRKPPPTPGGKALERLHQFERERGLEPTDIEHPQPDKPRAEERETEADECP
jgi:hypothetical protein